MSMVLYFKIDDSKHALNKSTEMCGMLGINSEHFPSEITKEGHHFEVQLEDEVGLAEFG